MDTFDSAGLDLVVQVAFLACCFFGLAIAWIMLDIIGPLARLWRAWRARRRVRPRT